MNFVDEENLTSPDVGEHAGEIELFLKNRAGSLFEADPELGGDDSGERGLAEARRAVEQNVIHCFAALFGGFDGDGKVLLELGLSGEIS